MIYICNSFSLAMLPEWRLTDSDTETSIRIQPVDPIVWLTDAETRHGAAVSAVGHADTAIVFSEQLARAVPLNRSTVQLGEDDELLIGQLIGGRLPEGATSLPENFKINWLVISFL